jgi:2'-hydroxyisoflavone reductase
LILGGTGFIGPHFVAAAVDRGHRVSVFNRGKSSANLPDGVERLTGDRAGSLEAISSRDWDVVFDLAVYVPIWVRTLGEALKGRVKNYIIISTGSVYQSPGAADEDSPVTKYTGSSDAYSQTPTPQYGPLKALCEREAERQFPGRTLVLRPGSIVGPGDQVGLFTYWPTRMQRGGKILVAGDPHARVQMIDVRDLAEWSVRMAEDGEVGIYNAIGPALPMSWCEMLGGIRGTFSVPMELIWVPAPALLGDPQRWGNILFWPTEGGVAGLMRMRNEKARAKGLTFRSLSETTQATLAYYQAHAADAQQRLAPEPSFMESSIRREQEFVVAWQSRQPLSPAAKCD